VKRRCRNVYLKFQNVSLLCCLLSLFFFASPPVRFSSLSLLRKESDMAAAANTGEAKVMILCGVLGVGCVIGVEIAHDATVASLRETFFNQESFYNQYKFAAGDWTLFMAQDPHLSDARLQWDVDLKPFLMHGRVPDSGFKKMDLVWRLDEDKCFGPISRSERTSSTYFFYSPMTFSMTTNPHWRTCMINSDHWCLIMNEPKWKVLSQELHLAVADVKRVCASGLTPVEAFEWESKREGKTPRDYHNKSVLAQGDKQREAYRAYTKGKLAEKRKEDFVIVTDYRLPDVDIHVRGHKSRKIVLTGTTDMLVASAGVAPRLCRAKMVIDVNKSLTEKGLRRRDKTGRARSSRP
jgi:hypothetical protein